MTQIINQDIAEIAEILKADLHKLSGRNVIITGASGMLGSYLTYVVIYANNHFFKKPAQLYLITRHKDKKFGDEQFIHYIHADIAKKLLLPKMHYVVHAASKAAPKLYMNKMIDTLNTNILGMYSLLALCDRNTKSFLYFSSSEIYGSSSTDKQISEDYIGSVDHLNFRACYIEAKKICETIAVNYFWEKKVPVKIVRVFHTFGPGVNLNDGRVFSDFIRFGLEHKDILIQGDPKIQRSMLYSKDATIMFFKVLLSDRNGEVYNVGSEKNIASIEDFAYIVCSIYNKLQKGKIRVTHKKNKEHVYYKNAVQCVRPSIKKFKQTFGYQPTTTITEAVERTVKHFLELGI